MPTGYFMRTTYLNPSRLHRIAAAVMVFEICEFVINTIQYAKLTRYAKLK